MISILENKNYLVAIDSKGAELKSFTRKSDNYEVIWQGDEAYWKRSSPTLFPFIGSVKNNHYFLDNKEYPMTRHGFLRDVDFERIAKRENFLSFVYESNEKTKEMFPFDFELRINYLLVEQELTMEYVLKNRCDETMYYNLGGHTAYNFDISSGDCSVVFEKEENKKSGTFDLETGLRLDQNIDLLNNERVLKMSYDLFKYDTLLLQDLASEYLILDQGEEKPKIKITFGDFPYLALWTPKAPFLCVEPWNGVTDDLKHTGHIEEKRGIQKLEGYGKKVLETKIEII
jgi:galactose mutarotase-like enzyme